MLILLVIDRISEEAIIIHSMYEVCPRSTRPSSVILSCLLIIVRLVAFFKVISIRLDNTLPPVLGNHTPPIPISGNK